MSDWAFVEHATNQLMRPRPGDSKHPTLWPSEATAVYTDENGNEHVVGKCRRAGFFRYLIDNYKFYSKYAVWATLVDKLKLEQKPVDKYMLWIWASGDLAEEYLIEQAKKSGVYVAEQVPIYIQEYNVSGKKDIEIHNPITGKISIVEAKSVYGFGANMVLGTESERRRGIMGTPRDSNLMQIALYHWWTASMDDAYEESRLTYIARDTGRYAEYLVRTVTEEDTIYIEYKAWHPYPGQWTRVPYTINDILAAYRGTQTSLDTGHVPDRDFNIKWTDEQVESAATSGSLGKTDMEKYTKYLDRIRFNEWIASLEEVTDDELIEQLPNWQHELTSAVNKKIEDWFSENPDHSEKKKASLVNAVRKVKQKKELKKVEKGDWQCRFCKWANTCYDGDGNPREL